MDDALHQLILRLHEVADRLESLAQERRPVAVENFEGYSIVYLSDGSILGECANAAAGWEELSPLPGTRRARELEDSPTPADYSPALDATEKLSAVVEAAQRVLPRMVEGHWQVPIREQHLVLELEAALAALERWQETEGHYTCRKCSARMEHAGNYGYCEDCEGGGDE